MQKRHRDRRLYFQELASTSREFYINYLKKFTNLTSETRILEIGCGEGGNLVPFAEMGCTVLGIDISAIQIENAKVFFQENNLNGNFVFSDFLAVNPPENEDEKYDIVLIHDVIEHIEPPYKPEFFAHMIRFMRPDAIAFFGFPAWQMPFGGHQQIGSSKVLSKIPFIHLLPEKSYRKLLEKAGENESTVNELLSIKRSKMPVELFEKTAKAANLEIVKRTLWIINPHYKSKFHLIPLRAIWPFSGIPYLRNFYCTSAWYILRIAGPTE